ncbi:Der GTPase-activating protein YihI [Photorhabdus heterorhabditis]|uniref:Der GTPase-activating protein YihI n=1 Tax=Photorhabdus heterorhabditis TaxID=880156 RepID=A0A5B0WLG4_9GAMM|nr:Der GTPase-activating protein YihI [Photorhabdus heterorhabditis]KAA1187930.1 Der GTPase-activating protein YihI [Photorhabdus heterorhabditis]KOY63299.1 GTPase activator [Photorhabdus heterorhabditis]MBS9440245.1 Der GTPase-activating protein YihI [Photorhabdus heterorhabditis]
MNPLKKKAPARASAGKQKRKNREELNAEGRARKRQKKHRGNPAGSRHQEKNSDKHQSGKKQSDPRFGSKVPVPLIIGEQPMKPVAAKPKAETKPRLLPQEELAMLENDDHLDALLERLENGEKLSEEENAYVDTTLDRIDALMEELGIKLDEEEGEEEKRDDIMQLLKGN